MTSPTPDDDRSIPAIVGGRSIPAIVVPKRPPRSGRFWIVGGGCLALVLGAGGAVAAWLLWPVSPPDLEVLSAEVVVVAPTDADSLLANEELPRPIETLRVRYRTDPDARVEMSLQPGAHDDDGEGSVEVPLRLDEIETSVTRLLRAQLGYDGPEAVVSVTATRTPILLPTRTGWRCSLGGCGASDESQGLMLTAPVGGTVTLGTASGPDADPTDDVLRVADPSRLWGPEQVSVPLPVRFTFSDGPTLEATLQLSSPTARRLIEQRLRTVVDGRVPVPVEGTGRTLLAFVETGSRLFGEASSVGEIGRVAVTTTRDARTACGTYRGPSGSRRLYVERQHAVITIFDRRTGRTLETRTILAARVACPRNVTAPPGDDDIVAEVSTVPEQLVVDWLSTR